MDTPGSSSDGPRAITAKNQLVIPPELLEQVGLSIGDKVHLVLNDDLPGTIVIMPAKLFNQAVDEGLRVLRDKGKQGYEEKRRKR